MLPQAKPRPNPLRWRAPAHQPGDLRQRAGDADPSRSRACAGPKYRACAVIRAPGNTPDGTIQGKTPGARATAFAALLGNATLVLAGPLTQNQTATYHL